MNNYNTDSFIKDLKELNINLDDDQIDQFLKYYELLVERNKVMNLTAIVDFDEVIKKHFIDSLSLIKTGLINKLDPIKMIDIGTGAGFPGIPLKIAFPNLQVVLLDSLNKRVEFLNESINVLGLDNIIAVHGRAEDYIKENNREKFDICVSRAVANLSTLSEYCLPYVKTDGWFIPYKAEKANDEIEQSKKAIHILGGRVEDSIEFELPDSNIYRNLVMIKKVSSTPIKYPRKSGIPSKKPL